MVRSVKLSLTMVNLAKFSLTKFNLIIIHLPKVSSAMVNIVNCIFNYASIPMANRFHYQA